LVGLIHIMAKVISKTAFVLVGVDY